MYPTTKLAWHDMEEVVLDFDYGIETCILGFHANTSGQLDVVTRRGTHISIEVVAGADYSYALRMVKASSVAEVVRLIP